MSAVVETKEKKEERLASWLFVAIGVGYLFPFSALTQPVDYWTLLFPDFDVEFLITAVYMWFNLLLLGYLVFLGDDNPSYELRIYGGFLGQFLALVVVPSSYFLGLSEDMNLVVITCSTAFAAAVSALIDSCAISLSAQYPLACQEALQLGIGVSTLIGSVYRIITKGAFPTSMMVQSSLLYFYSGAVTIIVCVVCFWYLMSMDISKRSIKVGMGSELNLSDLTPLLDKGTTTTTTTTPTTTGSSSGSSSGVGSDCGYNYGATDDDEEQGTTPTPTPTTGTTTGTDGTLDLQALKWRTFRLAAWNELVVFCLFASTLALWPPLITEIPSYQFPALNESKWWPLLLLFDFAVMDVVGRSSVSWRCGLTKDNIWIPVLIRILLFTPIIICLVKGYLFTHDFISVISVAGLGFTNGYLGSLSIVLVNDAVESVGEEGKGLVGTLTGFVLNAGLVAGATAAIFVDSWVKAL